MTDQQVEVEEFRRVDDPTDERVFYPVGWYDRYVELFDRFDAAKQAQNTALQVARDRLELARLDYAEARASAPEVQAARQAKADLTEFRKFVWSHGFTFPHPNKLTPHQGD